MTVGRWGPQMPVIWSKKIYKYNDPVEKCRAGCRDWGFPFCGIDDKTTCRCGNSYAVQDGRKRNTCNNVCYYNLCGGKGVTSVYYVNNSDKEGK